MCFGQTQTMNDRSSASGVNSVSIQATVKPPKGYGTGKGTTARILQVLDGTTFDTKMTSTQIGDRIGVPSRQLSKRLSELEKKNKVATVYLVTARSASPTTQPKPCC